LTCEAILVSLVAAWSPVAFSFRLFTDAWWLLMFSCRIWKCGEKYETMMDSGNYIYSISQEMKAECQLLYCAMVSCYRDETQNLKNFLKFFCGGIFPWAEGRM
jgi:hypothetical protein